jgi:ABC-2 type transport system permease protein
VVIPAGYARLRAAGRTAEVLLVLDGSNSVTASLALAYAEALAARENGISFAPRPRVLFNPARRSTVFLVPGLLAIITMFMTILLPSLAVVREKERGTIEILRAGPIRPAAFIVGKLLPYGIICVFDLLGVMIIGALVFDVGVQGSLALLLALSVPFLLTGLALGLLISTFVDSLQVAMYVAFLTSVLPAVLLSGFLFPISAMPGWLQAVTWFVPARYFLVVIRGIYLKSAPFSALLQPLLAALIFGTVAITGAIERLRRTL